MMISGPVVLVGLPLAVGAVLQLLRRWTVVTAFIAMVVAVLCGLLVSVDAMASILPLETIDVVMDAPLVLLGRVMVIEPVDRLPLAFIFFTAAGVFVIASRLLPHSNFFPVGLMMVALLSGALMVKQVVYTALLVEMAAILAVFPLHEPAGTAYRRRTRDGARYIAYMVLALPGLMVTQLLLDLFTIFPNDLALLQASTVLLGLSFVILLGAVPFQSWLSTVATDGSPPVVTFLFTVNLGTVWFMLFAYLESYSWLSSQALFGPLFTTVGLLMMMIGGALAASQRRLGRLVGYATLVGNGAMFVALGTRQVAGLALTVMLLIARPLAMGLMTLGLDGLRRVGDGNDSVEVLEGAAWRVPWRTVAFIVGGIAMAGFPLSLGFAAHWGLFRLLSAQNLFQAILALAGCAGVMMGLISVVRVLLSPPPKQSSAPRIREDAITLGLIVVLIGITVTLGIFPQWISRIALQMAEGFTFFTL